MSPPVDPIDLGIVNMPIVQPSALRQPFPQIVQPFVNEHGVINQSWLQLLIALWNRTGSAPGVSSVTNEYLSASSMDEVSVANAEQSAALGLLIQEAVGAEIAKLGLDQQFEKRSDPLEALLFFDAGAGAGADDDCVACSAVIDVPNGTRVINPSADFCGTIFTNAA